MPTNRLMKTSIGSIGSYCEIGTLMETHYARKVSDVDHHMLPARSLLVRGTGCASISPNRDRYIDYGFRVGTATPGIFTLTVPRWFRLVKYSVLQSVPPNPKLVVAGAP